VTLDVTGAILDEPIGRNFQPAPSSPRSPSRAKSHRRWAGCAIHNALKVFFFSGKRVWVKPRQNCP